MTGRTIRRVLFLLFLLCALGLFARNAHGQGVGFRESKFVTGMGPEALVVADFNGDGKLDLAVANRLDSTVSILLGNGDGTFGAKTDFPTGAGPVGIVADDFNGDGKLDLATVNNTDCTVSVLLGNGDGTFGTKTDFATGTDPAGITSGDFNGDGKPDLVTANAGGNDISILLGQGGGAFAAKVNFPTSTRPIRVVAGDFNGDGKLDVAALAYQSNAVSVLLGNGDGTFQAKTDAATGNVPWSLAKSNFDGDAKLDLITANLYDWTVSILRGKGDGTFDPRIDLGTETGPIAVTAADFNADGKMDFLTANPAYSYYWGGHYYYSIPPKATLRLGNGDGTFGGVFSFALSVDPNAMAIGDFNADGRIDVAIANPSDNSVSVLLQSPAAQLCCSVNFGNVAAGSTSPSQDVTLDSTGSFAVTPSSVALLGPNPGEFSIVADTCTAVVVNPLGHCTVSVKFAPSSAGQKDAVLSISHDAPGSPGLVRLDGNGLALTPLPLLAPSSVDFGTVVVGQTNGSTVTLTNGGTATLNITSVTLAGTHAAEFLLTNHCGATLAAAASCSIDLVFQPAGSGAKSALLNLTSNAPGSQPSVALTGVAMKPPPVISVTSLNFGDQLLGTSSTAQTVTLTNSAGEVLNISSLAASGDYSQTNNCGVSVAAGANCTMNVKFTPTAAGARNGTLTIAHDAWGSSLSISLAGNGLTPPAVSLTPASLTFSAQAIGSASAAQTVTLTNTGGATLTITSMSLSGANAGDFTRSDNCGNNVNGGANCVITVTFKPTAVAGRAASLSIASNAAGSPHSVPLAGTGSDFSVAPASGSSTSVTLSRGGSASIPLSFSPLSGFTGDVVLSCTTSSAEVGCSVPASVNINGITPAIVAVGVTATTRASAPLLRVPPSAFDGFDARIALLWMVMLVMMAAMLRRVAVRNAPMRHRVRTAAALAAVFLCTQLWVGCAGVSSPPPPRTYSVTVSASSAGATHTIALTVTVP